MMARSTTRSNKRPDILMQARRRQFDEIFLQRTAGPYIRVISAGLTLCRSLLVYPDQRTSSDRPKWSGSCQTRGYSSPYRFVSGCPNTPIAMALPVSYPCLEYERIKQMRIPAFGSLGLACSKLAV